MFFIFFSIVILLYGLINTYIYIRGVHSFSQNSHFRVWFTVIFWCVASSFLVGRLLERVALSWLSDAFVWIGSFWLGAMAYFLLFLLTLDLLRLINYFIPFFPSFMTRQVTALVVVGIVLVTVIGARINAMLPRIQTLELAIQKKSSLDGLNAVVVTDLHLGTIICHRHVSRIIDKINSLDPDIVLFAGDLVDEDIQPVIRQNLGDVLRKINSRYGLYGITGNHEYIGGVEPACSYLTDHGIVMLRDSSLKIAGAFTLVGREDISIRQFAGKDRKTLGQVMSGVDTSLPVILMDHQPNHLQDVPGRGIDLQLSGHTHHGQLWPFNYISQAVYELSWGYMKKENTHFYVSCGVGTWGPPMRTGNRPEVVHIKLKFLKDKNE
jgi:uncharacterized protein